MFEDVEDEFELDIINQRDSDDEEEKKSATRRRLSKKMNFSQVINYYAIFCDLTIHLWIYLTRIGDHSRMTLNILSKNVKTWPLFFQIF